MSDKTQIKAVVISISDSRGEKDDLSGVTLVGLLLAAGAEVVDKIIISDDMDKIVETLQTQAEREDVNLILTTGGTGLAPRDNTPEATRAVIEKEAPGMAEAMRIGSLQKTPTAMLSRGICGSRGDCLIVNLPGSPNGARECFEIVKPVLQHAVNLLAGASEHNK
jgi:molybdopterin adenylyltransferase